MPAQSHSHTTPATVAYGIDCSDAWVSVVRARTTRKGVQTETLLEKATDDPADSLQSVLQHITADVSLDKAVCAVALPARLCSTRWLSTPFPSLSKARKVLPALLDVQLPFPLESCAYGFPENQSGRESVDALAVVARHEDLVTRIAECKKWRLDPHVVDHEGLALWAGRGSDQEIHVTAYVGVDRTVWAVGVDGRFHSSHVTRTGTASFEADASTIDEWGQRALRLLHSVVSEHPNRKIHWRWTGPGAAQAHWLDALSAKVATDDAIEFETDPASGSALASALATRALGYGHTLWNFRAVAESHPQWLRWRRSALRRTAWTGLAAGILICALNLGFQRALAQRNSSIDRALSEQAMQITGLPYVPPGQEVILIERALEEQRALLAPFLRAFEPSRTRHLLNVLRAGSDYGLLYESVTLRERSLLLQGSAGEWTQCEQLAARLKEQGWNVQLDRLEVSDAGFVRFRIMAERI